MSKKQNEHSQLDTETDQDRKLIRINTVTNLTGLSKSHIYSLCHKGLFPKSLRIVPGGTSVAWVKSEVLAWIESRIQSRDEVA